MKKVSRNQRRKMLRDIEQNHRRSLRQNRPRKKQEQPR